MKISYSNRNKNLIPDILIRWQLHKLNTKIDFLFFFFSFLSDVYVNMLQGRIFEIVFTNMVSWKSSISDTFFRWYLCKRICIFLHYIYVKMHWVRILVTVCVFTFHQNNFLNKTQSHTYYLIRPHLFELKVFFSYVYESMLSGRILVTLSTKIVFKIKFNSL